jgi:hypothetical protein
MNNTEEREPDLAGLDLAIHLLVQEEPFGHRLRFSPAVSDLVDIPLDQLNAEQVDRLIKDAREVRREALDREGEARLAGTWPDGVTQ